MVCVAAFIILCLVGVFVAFLSIFRRDIGKKYWSVFKKAWGCVGKKVRLQKCETNFKDDVKNGLLSKVVLKHPKWVKPLGVAIEVSAVLIVFITIWSLVEAVKALLALWVFGTCNVSQPASCALGAEVCGIDAEEPSNPLEWTGRWFSEWGEIFANIPDRFQNWNAADYLIEPTITSRSAAENAPRALDVFDPGCTVCLRSYRNQKSSGFFDRYETFFMIYPIRLPDGSEKFANSELIARYIYASALKFNDKDYAYRIIDKLFTESNTDGQNFQVAFAFMSSDEAEKTLQEWLQGFGASSTELKTIEDSVPSQAVTDILEQVSAVIENRLHVKGIPTLIYDGRKHSGLFQAD